MIDILSVQMSGLVFKTFPDCPLPDKAFKYFRQKFFFFLCVDNVKRNFILQFLEAKVIYLEAILRANPSYCFSA